jgi:hypothetical protein
VEWKTTIANCQWIIAIWQLEFDDRFWILLPGDELRSFAPVFLRAIGQGGGAAVVGPMADS